MFGLVLLLIAGCSKEEIQPDPLNATDDASLKKAIASKKECKGDHYVPIKGTFEVYVDEVLNTPEDPAPPKKQIVLGSGKASHLGKTEVYIYQEWWPIPPGPPEFPWGGRCDAHFVFTAANGDELHAYCVRDLNIVNSMHHTPSYVEIYFECIINGVTSTGRFKGAKGSFIWQGEFNPQVDPPKGFGTVTLTGKIKY